MRKIDQAVVLGATGFIGNYLVEALIKRNIKVIAVMRKESENKLWVADSPLIEKVFISKDINSTLMRLSKMSNSVCYNLLWRGVAGDAREKYDLQLDNVRTALDSMCILREKGCKTFIGASSISKFDAAVYGDVDGLKLPGRHMYGVAKLAMDYMCRIESGLIDAEYINAIIGNVYGEYGSDHLILHSTIIKLLKHEETAFTDAVQCYDFVYIKDAVEALLLLAYHGNDAVSYYIGSGKERVLREYLDIIREKIDKDAVLGIGRIKGGVNSIPRGKFSVEKLKSDTGYCPAADFETNIDSVIKYYREKLEG